MQDPFLGALFRLAVVLAVAAPAAAVATVALLVAWGPGL